MPADLRRPPSDSLDVVGHPRLTPKHCQFLWDKTALLWLIPSEAPKALQASERSARLRFWRALRMRQGPVGCIGHPTLPHKPCESLGGKTNRTASRFGQEVLCALPTALLRESRPAVLPPNARQWQGSQMWEAKRLQKGSLDIVGHPSLHRNAK